MKQLYRAWDKRHNEMVYIDDFYWFEENGIHEIDTDTFIQAVSGEYKFMPAIGLEDKKGKLIYEDDVVELKYKLYPKKAPLICIVAWLDYKACFRAIKSDNFIANMGNTEKYSTTVIGNIHQNPEYAKNFGYTAWYPLNKKQQFFAQKGKEV